MDLVPEGENDEMGIPSYRERSFYGQMKLTIDR